METFRVFNFPSSLTASLKAMIHRTRFSNLIFPPSSCRQLATMFFTNNCVCFDVFSVGLRKLVLEARIDFVFASLSMILGWGKNDLFREASKGNRTKYLNGSLHMRERFFFICLIKIKGQSLKAVTSIEKFKGLNKSFNKFLEFSSKG